MSILKSRIVYGVEVSIEGGEVPYDIANGLYPIAQKYGLESVWGGRDGNPPTSVVIGKTLQSYSEEGPDNNVNLKELLESEEKAKENFPEEQILDDVHDFIQDFCLEDEEFISNATTIILHLLD